MKKFLLLFVLVPFLYCTAAPGPLGFHNLQAINMSGDTVSMSQYYGKKVMVVNCASFCSYTPQYAPLQQIYDQYNLSNHFEIIGFPSDDFFQGGTDSQIINTCHSYGVTFPVMATIHVLASLYGNDVDPVFQWLEKISLNGVSNATTTWNFNKFLVDEAGNWVNHYDQHTEPDDTAIINWILSPSVISNIPAIQDDEMITMSSSNPTSASIDFTVKASPDRACRIQLYSGYGQLIQTLFDGTAGVDANISYPVSSLSSGIYFISVQGKNSHKIFRCTVMH